MVSALTSPKEEAARLRLELAARCLKTSTLAKLARISPRVLTNILCSNDLNWPPRERINQALGVEIFAKPARRVRSFSRAVSALATPTNQNKNHSAA